MLNPLSSRLDAVISIDTPQALQAYGELFEAWDELRDSNPALRSPYFSPQFAAAIVRAGLPIELAVHRQGGAVVAILPFQRNSGRSGAPVGGGLNDAHGLISAPQQSALWPAILDGARIKAYHFHASPQTELALHALGHQRSFLADLTLTPQGYDQYLLQERYTIQRQPQKSRKLARQMGPLRLEWDARDPRLLELILKWKSNQYRRTNLLDIFELDWVRNLMQGLQASTGTVRGQLSVLFAGSTPVAGHFGLREGDLLHYWYPAYDPAYAATSPGTQLFLEIARLAPENGVRKIDFGYGEQPYKHVLCNEQSASWHGLVTFQPFRRWRARGRHSVIRFLKRCWLKDSAKYWLRKLAPRMGSRQFTGTATLRTPQ